MPEIIDSHYHLDVRMETIDELLAAMDSNGIDKTALIPTMCEPFKVEGLAEKGNNFLRKILAGPFNSIGRLIYRTTVDSHGNFVLLNRKYKIYHSPDNGDVAAAVEKHPERFMAWVFVNPVSEDAVAEAEIWMERPGAIGVKTHPFWHSYPVRKLDDTAALCAEKGWPLLLHLGGDRERGDYMFLPERHSKLNIIYAHAGVPFFKELWQYAKVKDNVFVDISSPYLDEPLAARAVEALGADKCIFGSDGPYGFKNESGKYDHSVVKGWIERLKISDSDREKVLGGNFMRVARR